MPDDLECAGLSENACLHRRRGKALCDIRQVPLPSTHEHIDLACLPPAVAESPAAGKAAAVKQGRRTVARLVSTVPATRRTSRRRMTVEEWMA